MSTSGSNYTEVYNFSGGSGGAAPYGSLLLSNNVLYGMTNQGGTNDYGTVFSYSL
jgi:uncharacterized repeat protein (TIGR03803 family)